MKINGQSNSDLLQRMQEMHKTESAAASSEAAEATRASTDFSAAPVSTQKSEAAAEPKSGLAARVETTATRALRGEFADDREVREAVIDAVLDERLGDTLTAAEDRKMRSTLKGALVDDPAFVRKVDDMLLLAARDLRSS